MNQTQATEVIRRLVAIWPRDRSEDTEREWMQLMRSLDRKLAEQAINELRDTLGFPPSVADFRSAYRQAQLKAESPDAPQNTESYSDLYGSEMNDWVYCFRCDMAITLEERSTEPYYAPGHGIHHKVCPRQGTAPTIPVWERMEREKKMSAWSKS